MTYNWEQKDWPNFRYDLSRLEESLLLSAKNQGMITGLQKGLSVGMQEQSLLEIMVAEAVKSFAIEGEMLSREDVLSSIRNNLGLNRFPEQIKDKRAEGIARLLVAVRESYAAPLTQEMLFEWHRLMMESYPRIQAGRWRSGQDPMQVISGPLGKEVIHFEAPPSIRVQPEMDMFIHWFNQTAPGNSNPILHPPVRAALAHVYFESIHPFEDGNGRIGRAISEKALSQGYNSPVILSLSSAIEKDRKAYYEALKSAQRSNEITAWIQYFINTVLEAQQMATNQIEFTLAKVHFFDKFATTLNSRQEKALNRMFAAGPEGFTGGMSAKKYMAITRTSKATATRDLQQLTAIGALVANGQGKSTSYNLPINDEKAPNPPTPRDPGT